MDKFIQVLPMIIILESFAASIILFIFNQYGSAVYWFSAGLLNVAVVFLIKPFG